MKKIDKIKTQKKNKGVPFQDVPFILFILMLVFMFMGLVPSQAEVAQIKSPLSWYEAGTGESALPKLVNAEYDLSGFVATQGQIKTISVNYEAADKVAMEVSADNGLHYYPVVNGVPLKSGFISGDRLRWRAKTLSDDAKLYSVKIAYTDTAGVIGTFGEPTLSGFKYRKSVFIKNSGDEILYNYQIKLSMGESELVKDVDLNCSGKTLADFKDIRFTAADAQTPLSYYLESVEGALGSRTAVFWVKIPQIPKEGVTLYLYYGNADAEDLSNPNKTFDFFEDFNSSTLDKNKWVVHIEPKGSAAINLGKMKLDAAEIISKDFKFKEGIIEYSCFVESGHENSLNIRNKTDDSYDTPIWLTYSSAYKGAEHCIAVDGVVKTNDALTKPQTSGETYNYRLNVLAGKIIFERFDVAGKELQASATYQLDPKVKAGYLSLRSGGDGNGNNIMNFGILRVRKSAAALPILGALGKEETVALPIFMDTTLSPISGVVLKDDAQSGYYLSQGISSSEPVKIIVPDWRSDSADKTTLNVKISADKGKTFKSGCEKEKFYYASKKDFIVGSSLKVRVDLSQSGIFQTSSGLTAISLDYRPGSINVIAPNGGEVIAQGGQREITWSAQDYEANYPMNIYFSADGNKNYTAIVENIPNSGEYLWSVVATETQQGIIKVVDAFDPAVFDISDKSFKVAIATGVQNDYLGTGDGKWSNASIWAGGKVPGLTSEVSIVANATVYADEPISFGSLSIGDGIGKVTTTVVLKAGVNKGSGEIIIRKGGILVQDGNVEVVMDGNLSVKSGGLLTHTSEGKIHINAKNINLEPGSKVDGSAKYGAAGGSIRMNTAGYFYISGEISADGDKTKGGRGGNIYLSSVKFGGNNSDIHARGGFSESCGGDGGEVYVSGSGAISGTINVNGGGGNIEGAAGIISFK